MELRSTLRPEQWRDDIVGRARALIRQGELDKCVLARELTVTADAAFDPATVMGRLNLTFPTANLFLVDGFFGASPELLVSRLGDVVRAHPLAGTLPRSTDPDRDRTLAAELLASDKNRWEHRITIDWLLDTLLPFCSYVDAEPVAVNRFAGQRSSPRHQGRGSVVRAGGVGAGTGRGSASDPRRWRGSAEDGSRSHHRHRAGRPGAATAARPVGSTGTATVSSRVSVRSAQLEAADRVRLFAGGRCGRRQRPAGRTRRNPGPSSRPSSEPSSSPDPVTTTVPPQSDRPVPQTMVTNHPTNGVLFRHSSAGATAITGNRR